MKSNCPMVSLNTFSIKIWNIFLCAEGFMGASRGVEGIRILSAPVWFAGPILGCNCISSDFGIAYEKIFLRMRCLGSTLKICLQTFPKTSLSKHQSLLHLLFCCFILCVSFHKFVCFFNLCICLLVFCLLLEFLLVFFMNIRKMLKSKCFSSSSLEGFPLWIRN